MIRPTIAAPPDAAAGLSLAGVGHVMTGRWGVSFPVVLAAAGTLTTDTLDLAGYNGFMVEWTAAAYAIKLEYLALDPLTGVLVETVLIDAGAVGSKLITFGAFGSVAALVAQVFLYAQLKLTNTGAGAATLSTLRLWCGTR